MTKLLLIDGSSLLHRAFYALPLLSNADGVFTNAVHGFMMMFNKLTSRQQPDYLAVCFDKSRTTFRTRIDSAYKGTRAETPLELRGQFELVKEVLEKAGASWLELADYEADDILGTLSRQGADAQMTVEIFSGDRDVFQLINDQVTVFLTRKGISDIERYDAAAIRERYGVEPLQMIEVKSLMGDSSDNIPGVPGVGEKTALKLICAYGSLDEVYNHLDEISGAKLKERLTDNRESAYRSRELATICQEAPIAVDWQTLAWQPPTDTAPLRELYLKLGLRQLATSLRAASPPEQGNLFGVNASDAEEKPWPEQEQAETVALCREPSELRIFLAELDNEPLSLLSRSHGPAIDGGIEHLALHGNGHTLLLDCAESPAEASALLAELAAPLSDSRLPKLTHSAKELSELLAFHHIDLKGVTDDVSLSAYLLDPAAGERSIAALAEEQGLTAAMPPAPQDLAAQAALLPALAAVLRQRLTENDMLKLYTDMELPLWQVLADMERTGVRVDGAQLKAMSEELETSMLDYRQKIYDLAGHEFNLNSPKQLGVVLFEEMALPAMKKTKSGYSTDAEVLEALAPLYPIAQLLLDYRLAAKLRSTYTEGLAKLINPRTERLHTRFTQTVTATGRLSSVEPNLQNIPVRQELGRRIRRVFSAGEPGFLLLAADYNQIELRILAHVSGDPGLIQAFQQGEDIHTRTASEVLGIAPADITPVQRRQAKAVNFGIVYGISDYGLSKDINVSRQEAADYIARYFERYPLVQEYQRRTIEEARQRGYVETLFGRRRYLPDLNNRNFNLRSFAQRMAINAPIQGSAADVIKLAMIRLHEEMERLGLRSKMLLQVHDELIFDMAPEDREILPALVREKMEQAVALSIPLNVDVKVGPNWYEMEKLCLNCPK